MLDGNWGKKQAELRVQKDGRARDRRFDGFKGDRFLGEQKANEISMLKSASVLSS